MDVDELLVKAWKAVEKSGVPESLHAVAFKEAVDFLRADTAPAAATTGKSDGTPAPAPGAKKPNGAGPATMPDEASFFATLAQESGMPEADLRDVLIMAAPDQVQVTTPTKTFGTSMSDQAKAIIAIVAAARSIGLGERPVSTEAVRRELERKNAYDPKNFSQYHLGPMKGFNASSRTDIVLTSKWIEDFKAAINKAHGRTPAQKAT